MIIRSISCTIFRPLTTNRIGKSLRWVTVGTDEGTDDNFSSDAENRKLNDKGTTSASSENQTHRTEPTTYSNYTNDTIRWWLGHGIFLQYRPSSVLLRRLVTGEPVFVILSAKTLRRRSGWWYDGRTRRQSIQLTMDSILRAEYIFTINLPE